MENRVPPPIYMLIFAILNYLLHLAYPLQIGDELARRFVAATLFAVAAIFLLASLKDFIKNKTTVNPLDPAKARTLVMSGVFKFSRNPMYLGMLLLLMSWALLLGNPLGTISVLAFGGVMNVWQIRPEERFLTEKFGEAYADYCRKVRRWL
ncbi:MAG: isoprenylcysteine carboxylmethyltransferase family protein [Oleiphilus sp.]|nr:MAG: isoprenylcysteine carboxylmethyltransferase family protein [Oleiphilus sp.]